MGIEVKIFYIKTLEKINKEQLEKILIGLGCIKTISEFENSQNFEINSKKGITEIQINWDKNEIIEHFSVRFAYGNPESVIDQTFNFFKKLNKIIPLKVLDVEEDFIINFDEISIKNITKKILNKKKNFDKGYMKIDKPIRGGNEIFDYIQNYKKKILDKVELIKDIPKYHLKKGSRGTLVMYGSPSKKRVDFVDGNTPWQIPLDFIK